MHHGKVLNYFQNQLMRTLQPEVVLSTPQVELFDEATSKEGLRA